MEIAATRTLAPAEFFGALVRRLRGSVPAGLEIARRGRLVKIWRDRPEIHFEVWHHAGRGRLEVGLHFEGPAALNDAAHAYFRRHIVGIKETLPRAELEPWDRGWSRLYQTLPATRLTEALLEEAAGLAAAYVEALQPLVDEFRKEAG